jgi:hypothetical protein
VLISSLILVWLKKWSPSSIYKENQYLFGPSRFNRGRPAWATCLGKPSSSWWRPRGPLTSTRAGRQPSIIRPLLMGLLPCGSHAPLATSWSGSRPSRLLGSHPGYHPALLGCPTPMGLAVRRLDTYACMQQEDPFPLFHIFWHFFNMSQWDICLYADYAYNCNMQWCFDRNVPLDIFD